MNTLIEDGIRLWYSGKGPQVKTIFNSNDKSAAKYFDISHLCGEEMGIDYTYDDGDQLKEGYIKLQIPNDLSENGVKSFIINTINQSLNG